MGDVRTEYVTMESLRPFTRQLAQLSQSLGLPLPMFKGRRLYTYGYGEDAWEITTFIFRDAALPNPAHLVYTKIYCNWGLGINLAIHEALSRQCHYVRHLLPADSPYRDYGRRDEDGNIVVTPGDRNNMPPRRRHIEDMERENGALAEKVMMIKEVADFTSNGMVVQGQEIDTLHEAVGVLENALIARDATIAHLHGTVQENTQSIQQLQGTVQERDQTIEAMTAQIAALQAQLNPPSDDDNGDDGNNGDDDDSGNDDDDEDEDDDDGDDNGGGDEAVAVAAESEEEEDPEEVEFEISSDDSGEVYTPPPWLNRGQKRQRMSARTYRNLFKK